MKKFIVKAFDLFCQFGVAIMMVVGLFSGYAMGASTMGGSGKLIFAVLGLLGGTILSVLIFGLLFVFMEIRDNTRKTAAALASSSSMPTQH